MGCDQLQKLPRELVYEVFSNIDSIGALKALIHASPYIYDCFCSLRNRTLQQVVFNELGPAIRDALFRELQDSFDFRGTTLSPPMADVTAQASQLYERLLFHAGVAELRRVASPQIVLRIIRRLSYMNTILDFVSTMVLREMVVAGAALGAYPLSSTERMRFLRALFRNSIFFRFNFPSVSDVPQFIFCFQKSYRCTFQPWELHQVYLMNWHLGYIRAHLAYPPSAALSNIPEPTTLTKKYMCELPDLWRKVKARVTRDVDRSATERTQSRVEMGLLSDAWTTNCKLLMFLQQPPGSGSHVGSSEDHDASDIDSAPYAWVDGTNGSAWEDWGNQLLGTQPIHATTAQRNFNDERSSAWWWFCFAMWDKDRITLLKTGPYFETFRTGWIANAWRENWITDSHNVNNSEHSVPWRADGEVVCTMQ